LNNTALNSGTTLTMPLPIRPGKAGSVPLTSDQEKQILDRIRTLGMLLDNRFTLPGIGIRFGWDGLIGLIPGVGDFATGLLSAYIVYLAHQLNVPKPLLARMLVNIVVDVTAGAVPVVGDLLDVAWKANLKNIRLLEQHLLKR